MSGFDKVIGYKDIKAELIRISDMMKHPDRYSRLGVHMPAGVLLYGDQGTGKTLMAQCFIEDSGWQACAVGSGGFIEGDIAERVGRTIEEAEKKGRGIIFWDDMDRFIAEGNDRVASAVVELVDYCREAGLFILATATDIQRIPDALLEAGRLVRALELECPTGKDMEILVKELFGRKKVADDVDVKEIARIMAGCSCPDLEEVINEAGMYAGYDNRDAISREDLIRSCVRKLLASPEQLCEDSKEETICSAVHEAGHAAICEVLKPGCVNLVSIRGSAGELGGIVNAGTGDTYCRTREEMEREILRKLGGKAAIEVVQGRIDVGCGYDLSKAFALVSLLVDDYCAYGFDSYTSKECSEALRARKDRFISQEMTKYYQQAKMILSENRVFLDKLVAALMEKKTLTQREIRALRQS